MEPELQTLDMTLRPIVFGNVYLNVPGGDMQIIHSRLTQIVESMGRTQSRGRESDLKKGIRLIYSSTICESKRQIKMVFRNVPNSIIKNSEDTAFVFRCSKKHFAEIIEFIVMHSDDRLSMNINDLIPETIEGLRYVAVFGVTEKVRTSNFPHPHPTKTESP